MSGGTRGRWYFKMLLGGLKGIAVVRNKAELLNKPGKPLGAISHVSTPSNQKTCAEATTQGFLEHAIQVELYLAVH